jgi:hypothetical protein
VAGCLSGPRHGDCCCCTVGRATWLSKVAPAPCLREAATIAMRPAAAVASAAGELSCPGWGGSQTHPAEFIMSTMAESCRPSCSRPRWHSAARSRERFSSNCGLDVWNARGDE